MPNTTEDSSMEKSHRAGSTASIAVWWKKFHFSGRVIMCSVLFGLGIVLIGGLVFAINMDDVSSSNNNSNDISELLPTKAPSKYVGPVIMGIGGFIVTVGIIMCLFETQVCRKKSGDSSPLISDKADPEGNSSDSVPVPSSSHGHKTHKHGKHSPKKFKSKHAKSPPKEKNPQKSPSPRSPPVSIHESKSFMTSSEEKFLTPPNVPNTLEQSNSDIAENPASSSLMKSFTSSDTSWTKSTEFLTPSTSFKDTSTSLNSSVEVNEKEGQVNFKTAEYMTPLTVEEENIQKLLIRVRNEQKEIAKREMEKRMSESNESARSEISVTNSPHLLSENIKVDTTFVENAENKNISTVGLPIAVRDETSGLNDVSQSQSAKLKNNGGEHENENNYQENKFLDNRINSNDHVECFAENNEVQKGMLHMSNDINNEKNSSAQGGENLNASLISDSSIPLMNKCKLDSVQDLNKDITNDETFENDLENSVSSDETVVSPDSFVQKSKGKESLESTLDENSHPVPSKTDSALESLSSIKSAEGSSKTDLSNILSDVTEKAKIESSEFEHKENDSKLDKHEGILPAADSS